MIRSFTLMLFGMLLLIAATSQVDAQEQAVNAATLDGRTVIGKLFQFDDKQVSIQTDSSVVAIARDRLLFLEFQQDSVSPETEETYQSLLLTDGSRLRGTGISSDGATVKLVSASLGEVAIPYRFVKSVRFQEFDEESKAQWTTWRDESFSDDRLVIRKGEIVDFLPGVITQYDTKQVVFLYDGSEIPVATQKVFGFIHPAQMQPQADVLCSIRTRHGELLYASRVGFADNAFQIQTAPGTTVRLNQNDVEKLDFSLGRLAYLSDMDPEGTEYTPFFDTIWEYQRDRTTDGAPLTIGGKEYSKGLWIHSKTKLTYRLAGEYRSLKGLLGIDRAVAMNGHGDVVVIISADNETLGEYPINAITEPVDVDLNVAGKQFLSITVDFGKGLDVGDHLDFVDAKLLK